MRVSQSYPRAWRVAHECQGRGTAAARACRVGVLREWLQAQGFTAPEAAWRRQFGGGDAAAGPEELGGAARLPDMRAALTLADVRQREAALRAADRGAIAARAVCSTVFWLCGHAVEDPERVAQYALEAKEHR